MLFLSQCIGRPVRDPSGEPIGKVADLIVAIGDRYPPVTGLVVVTDRRQIFLPWSSVAQMDATGVRLRVLTIDIGKFRQRPDEILLKGDLLDKQIVDIEGRKVIRVNDVSLDQQTMLLSKTQALYQLSSSFAQVELRKVMGAIRDGAK